MRTVKAILIDSNKKTIELVDVEDDTTSVSVFCKSAKQLLGCDLMCLARNPFDDKHYIYTDDEGLFNAKSMFQMGSSQPLANSAIIVLEHSSKQYHVDCTLPLETVRNNTSWIPDFMIPDIIQQLCGMVQVVPWPD